MKILQITPMYYPVDRGGERYAQEISERLVARGHEVTVVTTNVANNHDLAKGNDGNLPEFETINGVQIIRVSAAGGVFAKILDLCLSVKGGYRLLSYLLTAGAVELLARNPRNLSFFQSIIRSDADIIASWNWYWPAAYYAYLAKSFKRFRFVGIPMFHTAEDWVREPLYDRMIASCDAFAVNTAHEKEFILGRVPSMEKIAVVGTGVDPEPFVHRDGDAFRNRHAIGRRPLVGFVGSLSPNKGVDKIVEAMPLVWSWNKDVCLVLAGFQRNHFAALDQALHRLSPGERERILILPNIAESDKCDLYDALDVFVMPSTGESFGIAYLEAWLCRKPVIGSRIGSTACVIEEGIDGLLVEPKNPSDIARAIIELLADPDRRSRMGERGYAKTVEHFTWEKVCDRAERFFMDVIAETPMSRP